MSKEIDIDMHNILVYYWDEKTIQLHQIPVYLNLYDESTILKAVITIDSENLNKLNSEYKLGTALDCIYENCIDLAGDNFELIRIEDHMGNILKEYVPHESTPYQCHDEEINRKKLEMWKKVLTEEDFNKYLEMPKKKSKYWKNE